MQLFRCRICDPTESGDRKLIIAFSVRVAAGSVSRPDTLQNLTGVISVCVSIPAPESFPEQCIRSEVRQLVAYIPVRNIAHGVLYISPDISGRCERDRIQIVSVMLHFNFQRLNQTLHIIYTVTHFRIRECSPRIPDLFIVKTGHFLIFNSHL